MDEKSLVEKLKSASNEYYNNSNSIMSDEKFDKLKDALRDINPENPFLLQIGSSIKTSEWKKATHKIPMNSLNKVNTEEEFYKWQSTINDDSYIIMEKLDGSSIDLEYECGILIKAITRGNGIEGEDIYSNVIKMKNVKKNLDEFTGSIRGEILLTNTNLMKINKILIEEDESPLVNARNAANGIAKRFDGRFSEYLKILYYDISDNNFIQEENKLKYISLDLGLETCWHDVGSRNHVVNLYNNYRDDKRVTLDHDIDGLVIKKNHLDDLEYDAAGNPKFQIAWKFPSIVVKTKAIGIEWSMGNGDRITPVLKVVPVSCAGVTITNVSLHNIDIFEAQDLHENDEVLISRANDVIPKFVENLNRHNHKSNKKFEYPKNCSVCNESTEILGKFLICPNPSCKSKELGNLFKWIYALEIMDISDKTINLLYMANLIKEPADFYRLKVEDIKRLERMGDKSASKLIENINKKKAIELSIFISGLNIPQFSKSRAELLIENGYDSINLMLESKKENLINIKGIENKTAEKIIEGLNKKYDQITDLLGAGISIMKKEKKNGKLLGKSFCVTGNLNAMKRDGFVKLVNDNGGEYKSSVSKGLTYLVTNNTESGTTKNDKANKLGVIIINEKQFLDMIEER